MKYIKNFASGFTIAELIISLLISSVLIAAMVPVIGVKKVKYPFVKYNHGIAECYYKNNVLTYYYMSNKKSLLNSPSKEGVTVTGTHCTFAVPKTRYLQVFVIGAGGDSFIPEGQNQPLHINTIGINEDWGDHEAQGSITVDNNYQYNIDKQDVEHPNLGLSAKIRAAINAWSQLGTLNVEQKVTSPLGSGGKGLCRAERIDNNSPICDTACEGGLNSMSCNGPLKNSDPNYAAISNSWYSKAYAENYRKSDLLLSSYCWAYIHGKGQPSGYGRTGTIPFTLNADTQIETTQNVQKAGFKIINGEDVLELYLSASGNGSAPEQTGDGYSVVGMPQPPASECTSTVEGMCNNTSIVTNLTTPGSSGGREDANGFGCSGDYTANSNARMGKVESPVIDYKYVPTVLLVVQPAGGTHGKVQTMIYEKMTGKLELYPSRTIGQDSYITGNNGEILLSAESGTKGTMKGNLYNIVPSDLPFVPGVKKLAHPDNKAYFNEYLTKLATSRFDGGLKNCEKTFTCPGFGGNGAYLYLKNLMPNAGLTLTNTQDGTTYTYGGSAASLPDPYCEDAENETMSTNFGSSPSNLKDTMGAASCISPNSYKGNPGAVIIVW